MPKTLNNCSENLIIITAPSGAGKTTLIKNILKYAQENKEKIFLSILNILNIRPFSIFWGFPSLHLSKS